MRIRSNDRLIGLRRVLRSVVPHQDTKLVGISQRHSNDFCNRLRPLSPSTALVGGMSAYSADPP